MTDTREKRLAELVLDLEGLKSERKALVKEFKDRIDEAQERVEKLALDIRSGQLQIEDGPELKIIGRKSG